MSKTLNINKFQQELFIRLKCFLIPEMSLTLMEIFRQRWRTSKRSGKEWQNNAEDGDIFLKQGQQATTNFTEKEISLISSGNINLWTYEMLSCILRKYDFANANLSKGDKHKLKIMDYTKKKIEENKSQTVNEVTFVKFWDTITAILVHFGHDPNYLQNLKTGDIRELLIKANVIHTHEIEKTFNETKSFETLEELENDIKSCSYYLTQPIYTPTELSQLLKIRSAFYMKQALDDLNLGVEATPSDYLAHYRLADLCHVMIKDNDVKARQHMGIAGASHYFIEEEEKNISAAQEIYKKVAAQAANFKECGQDISEETSEEFIEIKGEDKTTIGESRPDKLDTDIGYNQSYPFHLDNITPYVNAGSTFAKDIMTAVIHYLVSLKILQKFNLRSDVTFVRELAKSIRACTMVQNFTDHECQVAIIVIEDYIGNEDQGIDKDARVCRLYFELWPRTDMRRFAEESKEMYPDEPYFSIILCDIYHSSEEFYLAQYESEKALQVFPDHLEFLFIRATNLRSQGFEVERVIEAFKLFVDKAPPDYFRMPEVYYIMACELFDNSNSRKVDEVTATAIAKYYCLGLKAEKSMMKCFLPVKCQLKEELKIIMRERQFREVFKKMKRQIL